MGNATHGPIHHMDIYSAFSLAVHNLAMRIASLTVTKLSATPTLAIWQGCLLLFDTVWRVGLLFLKLDVW
jgi:hypothetical protein